MKLKASYSIRYPPGLSISITQIKPPIMILPDLGTPSFWMMISLLVLSLCLVKDAAKDITHSLNHLQEQKDKRTHNHRTEVAEEIAEGEAIPLNRNDVKTLLKMMTPMNALKHFHPKHPHNKT